MAEKTNFLGTYFDKSKVIKLATWANWIAWALLFAYVAETFYNTFFQVYQNWINGYGLNMDFSFLFFQSLRIFQGGMLFVILQGFGQLLLMVMDIEDNTRRAKNL